MRLGEPLEGNLSISTATLLLCVAAAFGSGREVHSCILATVGVKSALHSKPVLDTEVGVDLGDVLDEEPCIKTLFTDEVEHADLGEQRFSHLRGNIILALLLCISIKLAIEWVCHAQVWR